MIPVAYNIRSLSARKATTLVTALGIGLVVFVLASALMLVEGINRTLATSARDDTAIVLRKGSDAELASGFDKTHLGLVYAASGVKRDAKGRSFGVGEVVVVIIKEKSGTDNLVSNVRVRGVPDNVLTFRDNVKIIAGRPARPGTNEVILGKQLRGRFEHMDLGEQVELRRNRPAKVVGIFSAEGSSFESEIWADVDVLRAAFGREGSVSSARVRLESASKFDQFKAAVESDKQLQLEALRETDYYAKQGEGNAAFVGGLGMMIAIFFGIGAMIGAAITMHAAVAQRRREIGTLRAIGFSRSSVLGSFLLEALLLAIVGGVIGTLGALGMGLVKFSMMNFAGWNEIVFSFVPTPQIIATAVIAGSIMGIVGGFLPAVRAARVAPAQAMRD